MFEEIKGLQWFFDDDSICLPESLELISEYDNGKEKYINGPGVIFEKNIQSIVNSSWLTSKKDIFPLYSKGVMEDWNLIIGVKPSSSNLLEWSKVHSEIKKHKQYIPNNSEIIFANTDSAFWEVFTRNNTWLEVVLNNCNNLKYTKVEDSNISSCYAL